MKFTLTIEGDNYLELQRIAALVAGADATEHEGKANTISIEMPAERFPPKPDMSKIPHAENGWSAPTPPVPSAPAAEPVGDDPTVSPPMYDKAGMPWDKRIHSESRSVNADGTWRKRRGVDPAAIAHVEAELRAGIGSLPTLVTSPPSAPAIPPPPSASAVHDDAHAAMRGPVQTPGPVPPGNYPSTIQPPPAPAFQPQPFPPQTATVQPPAAGAGGELNMADIMVRVGPAMSAGKLTQNDLAGLCAELTRKVGKTINSIVDCINDQAALRACSDLLMARGI